MHTVTSHATGCPCGAQAASRCTTAARYVCEGMIDMDPAGVAHAAHGDAISEHLLGLCLRLPSDWHCSRDPLVLQAINCCNHARTAACTQLCARACTPIRMSIARPVLLHEIFALKQVDETLLPQKTEARSPPLCTYHVVHLVCITCMHIARTFDGCLSAPHSTH